MPAGQCALHFPAEVAAAGKQVGKTHLQLLLLDLSQREAIEKELAGVRTIEDAKRYCQDVHGFDLVKRVQEKVRGRQQSMGEGGKDVSQRCSSQHAPARLSLALSCKGKTGQHQEQKAGQHQPRCLQAHLVSQCRSCGMSLNHNASHNLVPSAVLISFALCSCKASGSSSREGYRQPRC